jgi:hypothetical protein
LPEHFNPIFFIWTFLGGIISWLRLTRLIDVTKCGSLLDKGMNTKAHDVGTTQACSGASLQKISPKIKIEE